jgi:propanol-preferring alcohol dehydrogenase
VKAFVYTGGTPRAELIEIPVAQPRGMEVLVRVAGAGVCGTDLHFMEWPPERLWFRPPFVLGHEVAGWVEAIGSEVRDLPIGRPVLVHGAFGCEMCRQCRRGLSNYCERRKERGIGGAGGGSDGGLAEYMLVPSSRYLVELPGICEPWKSAPLADAGITSYQVVRRTQAHLVPGARVLVIGCGGLGHLAVQILRATSAVEVVVLDRSESAIDLARRSGAHNAVHSPVSVADAVDAVLSTGGEFEVVYDFVGSPETVEVARQCVCQLGTIAVVGIGGGALPVGYGTVPHGVTVITSYWGGIDDLREVVSLAAAGHLELEVQQFALAEIDGVFDLMRHGRLSGRAVVVP